LTFIRNLTKWEELQRLKEENEELKQEIEEMQMNTECSEQMAAWYYNQEISSLNQMVKNTIQNNIVFDCFISN
jgi:hypothetical protein